MGKGETDVGAFFKDSFLPNRDSKRAVELYVSTDIDDFDIVVGDSELNRRAWVLQESVLARQTIHFTAKQIYFECGEGVYCENLVKLEW
jgi:hypothetical protein